MRQRSGGRLVVMVLMAWLSAILPLCAQESLLPGPQGPEQGPLREQVWRVPLQLSQQPVLLLEATLFRPPGPGPFPLVVINHGTVGDPAARRSAGRSKFATASQWFVRHGYAVVIAMRRGFAGSEGDYAESIGSCDNPNYDKAGLANAADVGATVAYMRRQSFIDPRHVVVIGQSTGGFGVLALSSRNPEGVTAIINFAGVIAYLRSPQDRIHKVICMPELMLDSLRRFGRTARIPSLWIYSPTDSYATAEFPKRMFAAYAGAGAPAEFIEVPSSKAYDGHFLLTMPDGVNVWAPIVSAFLDRVNAGLGASRPRN